MPGVWKKDFSQIIAVCDVDTKRASEGKALVNDYYSKRDGKPFDGVKEYHDYRELIDNKTSTLYDQYTRHTHAMIGVAAARAKKHIYMQKPASSPYQRGGC